MFALNCKFKQHFTVNMSCFETGFISLFLKETKINTCTIYLFLIFLKYEMHEIVARKVCMYFVVPYDEEICTI